MRNRLFDEQDHYNDLGRKWDKRIREHLRPFITKAVRARISMLDLRTVMASTVALLCAFGNVEMNIEDNRKKTRKKRRK